MIVGPVQFDRPEWLWLAPVVVALVWWIGRRSLGGLGSGTRRLALAVRTVLCLAIVAALAEPSYRLERDAVAVVAVVDRSASMGDDSWGRVASFLLGAAEAADPSSERLGVVTVAEDAYAQVLPAGSGAASDRVSELFGAAGGLDAGGEEGTDLASGVQLGVALKPEDAAGRVLLVSDGNETAGSVLDAARAAEAAGVPVDVAVVSPPTRSDVVFESLVAPRTGRAGQRVRVTAVLRATERVSGRLDVTTGGVPVDISPGDPDSTGRRVTLERGANRASFTALLPESGPLTFEGVFTPDEGGADAVRRNNRQRATTFVRGEGRVLAYAMDPSAVSGIEGVLEGRGISVDVVLPGGGPRGLTGLQAYDAVLMVDVPQSAMTGREQRDLASYVHDTGGGFVMVGGPNSFGAGGWIDTAIADILPVRLDPPAKRQMPRGALGLVLDNSGSMSSGVSGTGLSQLEVAIEGAAAAVGALSARDIVMVTRFDSSYRVIVRPMPAGGKGQIVSALRRITSGGGTNMLPALQHTVERIAGQDAAVKHVVVLSDGQTMGSPAAFRRLTNAAANGDVTISTITIGDFSNDDLMSEIARVTGGTYYPVTTSQGVAKLPEIFIKEAQLVRRSLIWEGEGVMPVVTAPGSSTVGGLGGLPAVTGYVVTADRGGASEVTSRVRTDPDVADPLTAQWQHGLGRVAAVTTDAGRRWAGDWPGWAGYAAFWEQHVRWAMRPAGSANVRVATRSEGDETFVTVTALDDAGEPVNFGVVRGTVAHDDGREIASQGLSLRQTGPGRYEGSFESGESGSYLMSLRYDAAGGSGDSGTVTASVERPFADEFRARGANRGLLERVASVTGGRVLSLDGGGVELFSRAGLEKPVALTPVWLWLALGAVGLFLADVAIRRVRLSGASIAAWVRGFARRAERAGEGGVGSLRAARAAAAARVGAGESGGRSDAKAERAAARAEATRAREVASRKYEADESRRGKGAGAVVTPAGGGDGEGRVARSGDGRGGGGDGGARDGGGDADSGAGGMSRLMAAKRRARGERMSETGDDG